jgi:hypothetical protein
LGSDRSPFELNEVMVKAYVALSYSDPLAVRDDSQFLFAEEGNWFGVML